MTSPRVTVIIPARNAGVTLSQTLESLRRQSVDAWTAVVVDDGSSDDTARLATEFAQRDGRVRLIQGRWGAAGAARNAGIAEATTPWILFLDADDWISPDHLQKMLSALDSQPGADLAYCAYQRVMEDGRRLPPVFAEALETDPVETLIRYCPVAIHAVIVRRSLIETIGGFDPALRTCEDWDFWLKAAQAGGRFVEVRESLAFYRTSDQSLTRNGGRMVADASVVIARGCGPERADEAQIATTLFAIWCAGIDAGQGADWRASLAALSARPDPAAHMRQIARFAIHGLQLGAKATSDQLLAAWTRHGGAMRDMLSEVASWSASDIGRLLLFQAELELTYIAPPKDRPELATIANPIFDLRRPQSLDMPPGSMMADIRFQSGQRPLGAGLLAVYGPVAADEAMALALEQFTPKFLLRYSGVLTNPVLAARTVFSVLVAVASAIRQGARDRRQIKQAIRDGLKQGLLRHARLAAPPLAPSSGARAAALVQAAGDLPALASSGLVKTTGSTGKTFRDADRRGFWESYFQTEDPWNYSSAYEQLKYERTLSLLPDRPIAKALELACAEGMFSTQLAGRVQDLLAVDISQTAVDRAKARCSNLANVHFGQLDVVSDPLPDGLDLITASEFLYYLSDPEQVRQAARKMRDALRPGGLLLQAHAFVLQDEPGVTGFDWDHAFGVKTISQVMQSVEGLALERSILTELYRIDLFRKLADGETPPVPRIETLPLESPLEPHVEATLVWGGAKARRHDLWRDEAAVRVPVLMYHRIAAEGPPGLDRYRVEPEAFDAQLRLLRSLGYHSITSGELLDGLRRRQPFHGRPILITFDDGTRDFHDIAWPILRRRDFKAEVFVVTDKAGGEADWDARYGAPAPLMSWDQIAAVHAAGAAVGSHLASHTAADQLDNDQLLAEAARSRAMIAQRLGGPVNSIAAPYGVMDGRIKSIFKLAGYEIGFSTNEGVASLHDERIALPRLEVRGDMSLEEFARALGAVLPGDA